MALLEIENLSFTYDGHIDVLKNINLKIKAGSYVSIIGHNGSGKSTLAKLIVGLLDTKRGVIRLFDKVLSTQTITDLRPRLGIVFQNPDNQFIGATVADDIAFGLENRLVPHDEMQGIIDEFAGKVKMTDFLDKEPSNLSGGQKQRVAIAGVLAMHPDLIIMDEATAMLDPKGKREIRDITISMKKDDPNLTIISITHDIEEAYRSDEIIVLNEGEIAMQGTPEQVFAKREDLLAIDLDIPFVMKLKEALAKVDIHVDNAKTIKQVAHQLCR
ncbi:MAG TPA: energy-coupling factor transporter ATPase [Firmicutes bacterium]|nr:energy-coupling factor transporter ATPase [Bacillota bacterium]HAV19800.1 energy-coupling factor transporter ATPase [Bacillota bacterium]